LNIGINDKIVDALIKHGIPRFALDTYRRFIEQFGTIVLGVDKSQYANILSSYLNEKGLRNETDLTVNDLQEIVKRNKEVMEIPQDPWKQLRMAIESIFSSYFSTRLRIL